ncbi:hypothetical protein L7F22_056052, partial [Adiantum nelumboides]|nr:hypothetical protein [Adiantum nelumboides]
TMGWILRKEELLQLAGEGEDVAMELPSSCSCDGAVPVRRGGAWSSRCPA